MEDKTVKVDPADSYEELKEWLAGKRRVMLVCGRSVNRFTDFNKILEESKVPVVRFSGFEPNPSYESVIRGVSVFRKEMCDSIMAVGGGSAIDVAKCIRLYADMPGDGEKGEWLKGDSMTGGPSDAIPFLVMPTTAGSGSEATRFAVIYHNGVKQSITSEILLPDSVVLNPGMLVSLPEYQRKATMMDALCHAIESHWSVNSTRESREYSGRAIKGVLEHMEGYLANDEAGNAGMQKAAFLAGKAINITKTTAGHAMAYKITGLFGCAHGHAVALCIRRLFPWMVQNTDKCVDQRGEEYLNEVLNEMGGLLGGADGSTGAERFEELFDSLKFEVPAADKEQFRELSLGVNPDRMKNHPVRLDEADIKKLYHEILLSK